MPALLLHLWRVAQPSLKRLLTVDLSASALATINIKTNDPLPDQRTDF